MSIWQELKALASEWIPERANESRSLGIRGEKVAERFLKKKRLRIVGRGYRNHVGEIDLIAVDTRSNPRTIVFIEVKTRRSDFRGLPVEAVDAKKQKQITGTAVVYLKQHELLECRVRYDVVGIIWPEENARPLIQHYENAFSPSASGQMFE